MRGSMPRAASREVLRLARKAVAAVFPHHCVGCGREGTVLCEDCSGVLVDNLRGVLACPGCGEAGPVGGRCGRRSCASSPLDGLVSAAPYGHPIAGPLLRLHKYAGVAEAGAQVSRAVDAFARNRVHLLAVPGAVIVPVPLHPLRLARRGFDQVEAIVGPLSARLGLPVDRGVLGRRFRWAAQASIEGEGRRRRNAAGSVFLRRRRAPDACLLVDDVATTCATLEACASTLRLGGAKRVLAFTLLRG